MNIDKAMMIAAFAGICGCAFAGTVEVKGQAESHFPPDGMRVYVSVEAQDLDMLKSRNLFGQKNRALMQALEEGGVSTNEIISSDFSMTPQYHYENETLTKEDIVNALKNVRSRDKRVFDGYCHSIRYEVKCKFDRDRLEKIYRAIIKSKVGKDVSFDFFLMDPKSAKSEVRRMAVNDAKAAAEQLCAAAGATICGIQRINYNVSHYDRIHYPKAAYSAPRVDQDDDAPLFPNFNVSDIRIADAVEIVWEIK